MVCQPPEQQKQHAEHCPSCRSCHGPSFHRMLLPVYETAEIGNKTVSPATREPEYSKRKPVAVVPMGMNGSRKPILAGQEWQGPPRGLRGQSNVPPPAE